MYIYHPNTKVTHKNNGFIGNLMKVPAPLNMQKIGGAYNITRCQLELLELLESSVIGKQNTLVGLFLVTSTVATTSLVGYSQF